MLFWVGDIHLDFDVYAQNIEGSLYLIISVGQNDVISDRLALIFTDVNHHESISCNSHISQAFNKYGYIQWHIK